MHRLVQVVVRDNLEQKSEYVLWITGVLKTINTLFPKDGYDDPGCWPECGVLISHARVIAEYGDRYGIVAEDTAELMNKVAEYLHGRAQYEEAEPLSLRALEIYETKLGPDHPTTIVVRKNYRNLLDEME